MDLVALATPYKPKSSDPWSLHIEVAAKTLRSEAVSRKWPWDGLWAHRLQFPLLQLADCPKRVVTVSPLVSGLLWLPALLQMVFVCMSATVAVPTDFRPLAYRNENAWREEFARGLVQVDLEPLSADDRLFHQEANILLLPGVGMVENSGSLARYDRTRALASNGGGVVGLIVNLEGKATASQFGRDVTLVPGDAVACTPYEPEPGVLVCPLRLALRTCHPAAVQATRRRFDVGPLAAGRAERVRPMARTMRMTVPNSGLPLPPSAL